MNPFDMVVDKLAGLVFGHYRVGEHVKEFADALVAPADGICYGHPEGVFQLLHVDFNAVPLSLVHHVEVQDKRDTVFHKLNRQEEVAGNVRGVDDVYDDVRLVRLEVVANNLFFLRAGVD